MFPFVLTADAKTMIGGMGAGIAKTGKKYVTAVTSVTMSVCTKRLLSQPISQQPRSGKHEPDAGREEARTLFVSSHFVYRNYEVDLCLKKNTSLTFGQSCLCLRSWACYSGCFMSAEEKYVPVSKLKGLEKDYLEAADIFYGIATSLKDAAKRMTAELEEDALTAEEICKTNVEKRNG